MNVNRNHRRNRLRVRGMSAGRRALLGELREQDVLEDLADARQTGR